MARPLCASSLLALAALTASSSVAAQGFDYPDFSDITGLALNGDAAQVGNVLRVTFSNPYARGSAWYDQPVSVLHGFETTFEFRITDLVGGGADGMAFVIQNDPRGTTALADSGGNLGYGAANPPGPAIVDSLALEIDCWLNANYGDPDDDHCSVHTNSVSANGADETYSLGRSSPAVDMSDGLAHTLRISYAPGLLTVHLDALPLPILNVPYDFSAGGTWLDGTPVGGLDLIGGDSAYVGFTAGTGGAWENHDVLSWTWDSGPHVTPFCFGDGSGGTCPCGNSAGPGEGCANSTGAGALLSAAGTLGVGADNLELESTNLIPSQPALLFAGVNAINGGNGIAFGDGLRCAGGSVVRLGVQIPDAGGTARWGPGLGALGGWNAGDTRYFQSWYRDPTVGPCGTGFNLSHALAATFEP